MADAEFVRLEKSDTENRTVVVVCAHVCEAQRGETWSSWFTSDVPARYGLTKSCGCVTQVPQEVWSVFHRLTMTQQWRWCRKSALEQAVWRVREEVTEDVE